MPYTPLHTHSQYSCLDGASSVKDIVSRAKAMNCPAVALTDHGALHGIVEFYKECRTQGIKSLLGTEAYTTQDLDDLPKELRQRDNYHLVLIAKNQAGYKNLLWLISNANLKNFYYKPRINKNTLADHTEGLIALTACLGSETAGRFATSPGSEEGVIDFLKDIFKDDLYLEVQDHRSPNEHQAQLQEAYNNKLLSWSKKKKIPVVITSDSHYTRPEDKDLHDILMAIQLKKTLVEYLSSEEMRLSPKCHLVSPEAMLESARMIGYEAAFYNTTAVAEKVETFDIGLSKPRLPSFNYKDAPDINEFLDWCGSPA